jgi:hypothetical protein
LGVNSYFKSTLLNTDVDAERIVKKKEPIKYAAINIPSDAKKIEASYDGKYISYYENSNLTVVNCSDATKNTVNADKNFTQIYSKWLPDINSMILCERNLLQKNSISFFTYNAETNVKQSPSDTNNSSLKLLLNSSKDTISDVEMSTQMGIMFIKTLKSDTTNDIFNIDVNGHTLTTFKSKNIGRISVFNHRPELIYDDIASKKIKVKDTKWNSGTKKMAILGTSDSDNLYLGVLEDTKVTKIIYGSVDNTIDKWTSIKLNQAANPDSLILNESGSVYEKDSSSEKIINLLTNKSVEYSGTLIKITDDVIISLKNDKLVSVKNSTK